MPLNVQCTHITMHNGAFYREKCIDWCQNNLDRCEHFILRWAVFELWANFEWPKIILICSRLKVSICIQHTPPRRNFDNSMMIRYRVTPRFFKTYTAWPKFSSVSLYDEPFWVMLWPIFWKSAPNDPQMTLTCSRSKIPRCMSHTPPGPKFSSVSL